MSMCTRHLSDLNRPKAAGDLGPINPVSMHGVVALELEECVLRGTLLFGIIPLLYVGLTK